MFVSSNSAASWSVSRHSPAFAAAYAVRFTPSNGKYAPPPEQVRIDPRFAERIAGRKVRI